MSVAIPLVSMTLGALGVLAAQVDKLQIHAVDRGGEYLNDLGPGIWLCFGAAFAALASGLAIFETRRRTDADPSAG